jgi:hypothetical protein
VLPAGVREQGMYTRVTQEPGRAHSFFAQQAARAPRNKRSGIGHSKVPGGWTQRRQSAKYRQAKATKCGGMADEQSESADSTDERGELTPEDPREGSGRPV